MRQIDTLFVFGPRRSGTNYLSHLLLYNTNYLIASLDKSPGILARSDPRILTVGNLYGSKHNLDDVDWRIKFPSTGFYFFIFKPVEEWIYSRINYQKRFKILEDHEISSFVRKVIHNEYLFFLKSLKMKIDDGIFEDRFILINYKNLTPQNLLSRLNINGLSCAFEGVDCLREASPGGDLGGVYERGKSIRSVAESECMANLTSSALLDLDVINIEFYHSIFETPLDQLRNV